MAACGVLPTSSEMALIRERSIFAGFAGREAAVTVPNTSSRLVINCIVLPPKLGALQIPNDSFRELKRGSGPTDVFRQPPAFRIHGLDGVLEPLRRLALTLASARTADCISAVGLARPLPTMSGAVP